MNLKILFLISIACLFCGTTRAQSPYHFFDPEQLNGKVLKVTSTTHWDVNRALTDRDITARDTIFYDGNEFPTERYLWSGWFGHRELFKTFYKLKTADSSLVIEQEEVVTARRTITFLNKQGLPDSVLMSSPSGHPLKKVSKWNAAKRELILTLYNGNKPVEQDIYLFNKKNLLSEYHMQGIVKLSYKYTYKDFDKYGNWTKRIDERHQQVAIGPDVATEITERQIIYAN